MRKAEEVTSSWSNNPRDGLFRDAVVDRGNINNTVGFEDGFQNVEHQLSTVEIDGSGIAEGEEPQEFFLRSKRLWRTEFWSKECWCVAKVAGVLLLAILTAVAGVVFGPSRSSGENDSNALKCRTGSFFGNDKDSLLGTCVDPILELQSQALITGVVHGAVAADHPICSQMGTDILRQGGTAVDAAVTVALCLGVANPASSGMGGGAFLLVHADRVDESTLQLPPFRDARDTNSTYSQSTSGKVTEVIDCRETAPAASQEDMFLNSKLTNDASTFGGLAVAVPGELKGLELAHARHGKLAWADLVRPVWQLASDGVPVNANLAREIKTATKWFVDSSNLPSFLHPLRKLVTRDDKWKHPLKEGDNLRNPALANTLYAIMEGGSQALFSGQRAQTLAQEIQAAGGIVTADDLESYKPTLRTPIVAHNINGFTIAGVPPPSSGGAAVIGIARFLASLPTPLSTHANTLSKHWFAEACRHVFAVRMSLSDPDFNSEVVRNAVQDLVSDNGYMDQLAAATSPDEVLASLSLYGGKKWAQVNDEDASGQAKDGQEGDRHIVRKGRRRRRVARTFGHLEDHGTSHFSVVDQYGNAVSVTSSINTYFGSCVASESTGILLNNQMDDFATPGEPNSFGLPPSESNFVSAGKKPLSSMSPTLVFRTNFPNTTNGAPTLGPLVLSLGGSGGPKIITAVVQVFLNYIMLGMPLYESMVAARIHDQLIYNGAAVTAVESSKVLGNKITVSQQTRDALLRRKHNLLDIFDVGCVQAVAVDSETGTLEAVCDVRKGGSPSGY